MLNRSRTCAIRIVVLYRADSFACAKRRLRETFPSNPRARSLLTCWQRHRGNVTDGPIAYGQNHTNIVLECVASTATLTDHRLNAQAQPDGCESVASEGGARRVNRRASRTQVGVTNAGKRLFLKLILYGGWD